MSFAAHRLAHRVPFQQLILTGLVTVMEYPLSKIITPRPRGTEIFSLFIGSREKDSLLGQRFSIFSVLFSTCSLPNKAFLKNWKRWRDLMGHVRADSEADWYFWSSAKLHFQHPNSRGRQSDRSALYHSSSSGCKSFACNWQEKGTVGCFLSFNHTSSVMTQTILPYSSKLIS